MNKISIEEIVIVEGRDDTREVLNAVNCKTIETHGFGITKDTWDLIEKAYKEKGIIIFTDPDHAGSEIRKKIKERFPNAKEAFLSKSLATKNNDIGIENAKEEDIIEALKKAHFTIKEESDIFSMDDLIKNGITGNSIKREKLGNILGIGYSNNKSFLKKLNSFGITREEFIKAVNSI